MSRSYDKSVIRAFILLTASLICAILCAFVFAPLEMAAKSDILYKYSLIPDILQHLRKMFESLSLFLLFGVVAFSGYFWYNNKPRRNAFLALAGTIACLKWILNFLASAIFSGVVNLARELGVTLAYTLLDVALIAVVYAVGAKLCKTHYTRAESLKKARRRISGIEYDERAEVYPFNNFFCLFNPVLFPSLIGSAVYAVLLLISRLVYDISWEAPTGALEVLFMIFGYAGDIINGLLCYVICYFSAIFLFAQNDKRE